ncbi:glutathione ABC transporter ATP-binding protein [Pseudarthrobacter sulfonivorans]|uniref:Glutathione ABC transporter ATP-binding protein n=1 Tax=Pseudarthrobacter sulfonivorans TaxID=121292 RepID=A0A0U2XEI6_9MICC|nr:dipeptide ABC transporter ATP-binding protein [Pseudarthrobacter sulfonivorans]ALV42354.1 glutathione ABC transporter ATP-binding protein [Pseudarthrobacter sulfonivorans]
MSAPILEISGLSVEFRTHKGWRAVTSDVSLDIRRGETIALVGESGSGKSVTAMSVLNLLPKNARRLGSIKFQGEELLSASEPRLRKLRGQGISMIFQEPMTALNPVYTVESQLCDAILSHRKISKQAASELALKLLQQVHMPSPEKKLKHYPHQLSGGQRQRVMIAMAISSEPQLLIADEPTTALDVTVQAEILDLLLELQKKMGMAVLLITHDMGVVADVADRVFVMSSGNVVEHARTEQLFAAPQAQYTRDLLNAVPYLGKSNGRTRIHEPESTLGDEQSSPVLELRDTVIEYPGRRRHAGFRAVDGVSFSIKQGEILGLVGESGSGKTTIGRAAIGLIPATGGSILINGADIGSADERKKRAIRKNVSIVFQDPASSLNPRVPIGRTVTDPLRWAGTELNSKQLDQKARDLLDSVRIPTDWASRYPHELSGGQRQRIGIARAIAIDPLLMVADEPTSALDVSVQASVLELLLELQRTMGFSCLFISHDLSVVERLSNRVAVLNKGTVVEIGDTHDILHNPQHPYTQRLLAAAPVPDPVVQRQKRRDRMSLVS